MNRFTKIELIPVSAPPTNGGPNAILYFDQSNNQLNFLAPNLTPGATNGTLTILSGGSPGLGLNTVLNANLGSASVSGNVIAVSGITTAHIGPYSLTIGQHQLPSVSGNIIATPGIGPGHLSSDPYVFLSGITMGLNPVSGPLFGQTKLVAGSGIAVSTAVGITSTIILSIGDAGNFSTLGTPYLGNKAPGKSFQIRSTNGGDTSVVYWHILN